MGVLRFLLALAVIIAHSTPIFGIKLTGGEVAVQAFFVISGFYMALILTEKYVGLNGSFKLFISNRLLKLFPVYWVMLFIAVGISVVSYVKLGPEGSYKIRIIIESLRNGSLSVPAFIGYCFSSIFLFFQDWFIFLGLGGDGSLHFVSDFHHEPHSMINFLFLPQSWTIGLELAFYLLAPFIIKRGTVTIIILLAISVSIRLVLHYYFNLYKDPWSYRFFPNELAYFLLGILGYRCYNAVKDKNIPLINNLKNVALPVIVLLAVFYQWMDESIISLIFPIAVALLIPFIFLKLKSNKFDNKIGELSYPMYMSHITIIIIVNKLHMPMIQSLGFTAGIVSVIFSYFLNRVIADRIERYRQRRVKKNTPGVVMG